MRAAVLFEQGKPQRVEDVALEAPRQGEVLVRMAASGVGSYVARMRPASMREKSSRVLTSLSSRSELRWATSGCLYSSDPGSLLCSWSSSGPSISVSGVRNSWLTFEKNCVFARSSSASASARRRSCSYERALATNPAISSFHFAAPTSGTP